MNLDYRYEIKFVLSTIKFHEAINWLHTCTNARKAFENRTVNSIYFDDINFSSVRDNLSGIANRSKYRLRWYENSEHLNFEEKIKRGRLSGKKIYPINLNRTLLTSLRMEDISTKLINDLALKGVLLNNYMMPTLKVSYERDYYETEENIRITLDQKINFSDIYLHSILSKEKAINYSMNIMEIKFSPNKKTAVSKLIKSLNISPTRHSKYLTGMAISTNTYYI
tara:strand:+ start:8990 stop:9661 length:672 start_codon:yes stop_codon:yes gene_type:complete